MEQDRRERWEAFGIEILKNCRNELYRCFPYLGGAFAGVSYRSSEKTGEIGTDGMIFYFYPEYLLSSYERCPAAVRRGYLHMLLHCLFLHVLRREERRERLWDLACDIAVEQIIDRENREELADGRMPMRKRFCREIGGQILSVESIYDRLEQGAFSFSPEQLESAFHCDDHSFWIRQEPEKADVLRAKWEKLCGCCEGAMFGYGHSAGAGRSGHSQEAEAAPMRRKTYDYRRFLKQFAVLREEMELDTENFDLIYYHYGMEHYGDLPLIEPLEYKEGHKLEELVIAIDTSGSCSAELVAQFLEETYGILSEKENFFQKMKVYFIQCDCFVQDVKEIRSGEEWMEYRKHVKIYGRSDTDFRPVFRYVRELQEKRELKNLKALLYFTDGDGIYPDTTPGLYQTAFVFVHRTPHMEKVPPWALRLTAESGRNRK